MRKTFCALGVVLALAVALVVLGVAPALAASTHVFSTSFGEPGSGAGQLELRVGIGGHERESSGVAVNAITHDVYVADTGNHRIDQFSSTGAFIRAWGWGVADGLPAPETCTLSCQAGIAGSGAGQFQEPSFVAVDNSGGPSEGDVYVVESSTAQNNTVSKFSPSGAYLSTNDGSGATRPVSGPFESIVGIAVDSSGNLWVGAEEKNQPASVFEFAQDGAFRTDWEPHRVVVPGSIAVDSFTNVYVITGIGVTEFTSSGGQIGDVQGDSPSNSPIWGVAIDPSTDDLYADEGGRILHYAPPCDPSNGACALTDSFGSGSLNAGGSLAVDPTYGTVYAADYGLGRVAIFGSTPDLSTGQSSNRTSTGALLSGTVDPRNTAVSDCHFDYVANAEYAPGEPDPYAGGLTVPCVPAPGAGNSQVAVHAEVTGLTQGITYHFRLQATNAYGTSFGSDQTIPGSAPAVDFTGASNVSATAADLHAQVNPDGGETTYRFEYGTGTGYGADAPVSDGDIGHETSDVAVSQHIQGLAANTTYHYRVMAHNQLGTVAGPDHTLLTQPIGGAVGSDTCPNATIRAEQRAGALPDCRAYEQVSPPEKNGGLMRAFWQSSLDGNAIGWASTQAFGDAQSSGSVAVPYLSSRTADGWSTHGLLPPQEPGLVFPFDDDIYAYSSYLSTGILGDGGGFGQDEPPLVPGEPANNYNLFLRDNRNDTYQLIDVTPAGVTPATATLLAASPDLSHVVFAENAQLTADSPPAGGNKHLYEWSGGAVHLLGILPDGTAVPASLSISVPENRGISDDGSRVFFTTHGAGGQEALYLRQDGTSTVQLDATHGSGPGGGGQFAAASNDGSVAFFTDGAAAGLTNDTVPNSASNLYRYDANGGTLTDLTPVANAEVLGVVGASSDGSYVYFIATGVLAPGASPGSGNLYLDHNGATTLVSANAGQGVGDVVSPDGHFVAFEALSSVTGYDNTDANTGQPDTEVYLYDALSGQLSCASCNPSGAAPIGESIIHNPPGVERNEIQGHQLRYLAEGGRLFFNSLDSLSPRDANGRWDVYEYEPGGLGDCAQASGCVSLISSGISQQDSVFRDSSLTGDDAFFTTTDQLVAQDTDVIYDYYDARVDGGFAAQNQQPAVPCGGESCKPPASSQPVEEPPSSSGLSGPGNLTPSTPAPVHKKAAKKKHHAKKKRPAKRKRHPARGRRANHNRRGAK